MIRNNYIFVDFESVQDIDLALIEGKPVKVFLFIGEQQHKVSVELTMQALRLHDQVQVIKLERGGKNALDFVLAHHTGRQAAADPNGFIHILSKDKGFDALVAHLNEDKNGGAARSAVFAQIPALGNAHTATSRDRLDAVKAQFSKMKKGNTDSRPKKRKTLCSKIQEVFQRQLGDEDVQAVITGLEQKQWIRIVDNKVAYQF
ncbi:MAG: PIN domain-containing protein [Verrucomicrobia bacterium]|nr:PIN domain-containing protein [Verrucomicrobiota bacterium]